jgi:hypothetical protein
MSKTKKTAVRIPVPAAAPVPADEISVEKKTCRAADVGHRSCRCGREGCGNGS